MEKETVKLTEKPSKTDKLLAGKNLSLAIGIVMIVLGILFLLGQVFHISLGRLLWPLWIMVPGAVVLLVGLSSDGEAGEAMSIIGSIVTLVGAVLFYQNASGHWESWAYAWALVGPTAVGLGLLMHGALKGHPDKVKSGRDAIRVGLIMFAIGAIVFELVIGISGFGLGRLGLPILLIVAGLAFLARNIVGSIRRKE